MRCHVPKCSIVSSELFSPEACSHRLGLIYLMGGVLVVFIMTRLNVAA